LDSSVISNTLYGNDNGTKCLDLRKFVMINKYYVPY